MKTYLDVRTLSFTTSIISLIVCLCMLYVLQTRKTYPGFRQWTIASFLGFLGFILMSGRGILPDFLTIIAANTLIIGSAFILAYGLETFAGNTQRLWLYITPLVMVLVALVHFTYFSPSVNARIITISGMYVLLLSGCAALLFRIISRLLQSTNWLLILTFLGLVCWHVFRIAGSLLFEASTEDFMASSVIQGITFIVSLSGTSLICMGLMILNFQRVERDLLAAMDQIKTLKGIIPICSHCKKIRDDKGYWNNVESYVRSHSEAEFSHGFCPECAKLLYPELHWSDEQV
jgi:hypothetical protein